MNLTLRALEALGALAAAGEFHLVTRGGRCRTWRAPHGGDDFGGRAVGALVRAGLAERSRGNGTVVVTGRGRQVAAGTHDDASPPQVVQLNRPEARALGILARHRRLVWSSDGEFWETAVPEDSRLYRRILPRNVSPLVHLLLATSVRGMVAEITPHGDSIAFRLGLDKGELR